MQDSGWQRSAARGSARWLFELQRDFPGKQRLIDQILCASHGNPARIQVDPFSVKVNLLQSTGRWIALYRRFPGDAPAALSRLCRAGMTAVDVGANIGYTSLIMAEAVGPSGSVYCFEPNKSAFHLLRDNLEGNGFSWAHAEQAACGRYEGSTVLNLPAYMDDQAWIGRTPRSNLIKPVVQVEPVQCEVIALGRWLTQREIQGIDLLKIDVEGAEWEVLKGMVDWLQQKPPIMIYVETVPSNSRRYGYEPAEMLRWLEQFGYESFVLQGTHELADPSIGGHDVVCKLARS